MNGYVLYLLDVEDPTDGYQGEPYPLRLAYADYREACRVRDVLQSIYGMGRIEIEPVAHERSLAE